MMERSLCPYISAITPHLYVWLTLRITSYTFTSFFKQTFYKQNMNNLDYQDQSSIISEFYPVAKITNAIYFFPDMKWFVSWLFFFFNLNTVKKS